MRKKPIKCVASLLVLLFLTALTSVAAEPVRPDGPTAEAIATRLAQTLDKARLAHLEPREIESLLREDERASLARSGVRFRVEGPVIVSVVKPEAVKDEPFWLKSAGFVQRSGTFQSTERKFEVWEREYPAGEVELGIASFRPEPYPYFVLVRSADSATTAPAILDLWPGKLKLATATSGAQPYVDRDETLRGEIPAELAGLPMIRTSRALARDGAIFKYLRQTKYPATPDPDQVTLTWSADPKATQDIQWRTSTSQRRVSLQYRQAGPHDADKIVELPAVTETLQTPLTVNDPAVNWHRVKLRGLRPGTRYEYRVSDTSAGGWSEWSPFQTAPEKAPSFSFLYVGDAQTGMGDWGRLMNKARKAHPASAFFLVAGDLVDRGPDRDDWDDFLVNASSMSRSGMPLVPVLGNHDVLGGRGPELYLRYFSLPANGPQGIGPGRAYSFEYGDALFVVLDSNLPPAGQTDWLKQTLSASERRWKFVSMHHPLYPSHPKRSNDHLLHEWGPVFDQYGVHLVLQGHDHAYLRTHPMRDAKRADNGPVYVVAVSGTKMYEQADRDYAAVRYTDLRTYQVITVSSDSVSYKAFDPSGEIVDEFVLHAKPGL